MKMRHLFFTLIAAVAVTGCKTKTEYITKTENVLVQSTEVTLTPVILERLKKMPDFTNIKNYQFMLSGQIKLNIVETKFNDRSAPDGKAVFENIFVRKEITFEDKMPGQATFLQEDGDVISLRVCFESQQEETKYPSETHCLVFRARKSEQNAYFSLDYTPRPDTLQFSAEKGTLQYGGNRYTLLFNEDTPYLLLKLDQNATEDKENRSPGGRLVNTGEAQR
jgi:hypothetical protein